MAETPPEPNAEPAGERDIAPERIDAADRTNASGRVDASGRIDASGRTRAVAIKKEHEDRLPRVTASGEGVLAERILDIAFEEGVKVRQDKELTEILAAYDIDSPIPLEALGAVSEILRHVYAENARMAGKEQDNESKNDNKGADD